jgi:hypothetical protein
MFLCPFNLTVSPTLGTYQWALLCLCGFGV